MRALRVAQAVARIGPVLGGDWGRRDFLRQALGTPFGLFILQTLDPFPDFQVPKPIGTKKHLTPREWRFPRIAHFLAILSMLLFLVGVASASGSGSGTWIDTTCYLIPYPPYCIVIAALHKSNVYVYSNRPSSYLAVVDWQTFGGVISPGSSACGNHRWLLLSATWMDNSGSHPISGWYWVPSMCNPSDFCVAYRSDQDFYLWGTTIYGDFYSRTYFGMGCFPNVGPARGLRVYP